MQSGTAPCNRPGRRTVKLQRRYSQDARDRAAAGLLQRPDCSRNAASPILRGRRRGPHAPWPASLPIRSAATSPCWRWRRRCSCRCRAWASPPRRSPAYMLLGADDKWLATAPIFLVHLGIMGTTIPASLLMGVIGRRAGFSIGALLGVVFGALGCLAMYRQSFPLLCLASVLQGMQAAFFWYFRLAAADAVGARLPLAGHLAGDGRRRAGRLSRPADRQMGGRLAGAGDVRRHLPGHRRLLHRRARAGPAAAHPAPQRRRARRGRPADAP